MSDVQDFITSLDKNQRKIVLQLDQLLMNNPQVVSKIRYRVPFYYHNSWFCYLNPLKNEAVEMVFIRGKELSNSQGLLQAKNRKMVKGVQLIPGDELPLDLLNEIIQEALIIDETVPYSVRRPQKSK